ncbi:winged helix-turn-helix transcriptional regulator [Georgenia alba]|uniref:Winged helix-turn-helix transcriptional regulator n=1 Tax=Georgenia alba TaxID=2233858 RepID=A0ABW2Q3L5_9MICO
MQNKITRTLVSSDLDLQPVGRSNVRGQPRSGCAINAAVEVLGDAWSLIVLRDIVFGGRRHFRELLTRNDEGIASNILASRLRKLVDEGLLSRDDATRGRRATYSLTEAGIQTLPVMVALGTWGMRHRPTSPELTIRARLLAESPALVDDLIDELREIHVGVPRPHPGRPLASERLQQAYEETVGREGSP